VWIYTQSNITSILFSWVHYTNTGNISFSINYSIHSVCSSLFTQCVKFIPMSLNMLPISPSDITLLTFI
jgi:hypothetical protein